MSQPTEVLDVRLTSGSRGSAPLPCSFCDFLSKIWATPVYEDLGDAYRACISRASEGSMKPKSVVSPLGAEEVVFKPNPPGALSPFLCRDSEHCTRRDTWSWEAARMA